jgi:hypothetical protein
MSEREQEPNGVTVEALAAINAELAEQVRLQTSVADYFKKVHADALADCATLRARCAELEARNEILEDMREAIANDEFDKTGEWATTAQEIAEQAGELEADA